MSLQTNLFSSASLIKIGIFSMLVKVLIKKEGKKRKEERGKGRKREKKEKKEEKKKKKKEKAPKHLIIAHLPLSCKP